MELEKSHGTASQHSNNPYSTKTDEELLTKDPSNKQMAEIEKIEGTPFTVCTYEGKSWLALGKYRLTDPISKEEAIRESMNASWERIMQIMNIMIMEDKAQTKIKKSTKTK